jgi:hypothetical protein
MVDEHTGRSPEVEGPHSEQIPLNLPAKSTPFLDPSHPPGSSFPADMCAESDPQSDVPGALVQDVFCLWNMSWGRSEGLGR